MKEPIQCVLWNKSDLAPGDLDLEMVNIFLRNTHIERDLLKCRECGQLYFHEWYEHVGFKQNADMYDTYIPIANEDEAQQLLKIEGSTGLTQFLPQLHGSFSNGKNDHLRWIQTADQWNAV